ncbi:hypothetical protein WP1_105 [Pseudomonas phage WP1]
MVTSVKARCLSCDRRAVLDERKLKSKRPPAIVDDYGGSTMANRQRSYLLRFMQALSP